MLIFRNKFKNLVTDLKSDMVSLKKSTSLWFISDLSFYIFPYKKLIIFFLVISGIVYLKMLFFKILIYKFLIYFNILNNIFKCHSYLILLINIKGERLKA